MSLPTASLKSECGQRSKNRLSAFSSVFIRILVVFSRRVFAARANLGRRATLQVAATSELAVPSNHVMPPLAAEGSAAWKAALRSDCGSAGLGSSVVELNRSDFGIRTFQIGITAAASPGLSWPGHESGGM